MPLWHLLFSCRASLGWLFQVVLLHKLWMHPETQVWLSMWVAVWSQGIFSFLSRRLPCHHSFLVSLQNYSLYPNPDRPARTQSLYSSLSCLLQTLSELSESTSATSPPTLPRSSGVRFCPVWRATTRSASARFRREEQEVVGEVGLRPVRALVVVSTRD